jgi:protein-disulfide isomerase
MVPVVLAGLLAFAPGLRAQTAADLQQMKKEIEALKQRQDAMQKEIDALKAGGAAPAPALPADGVLKIDKAPVRGSASARVVLIEVSDFECPFCGRHVRDTAPAIEKDYVATGKIRHAFVNYPLTSHANAFKAAEAGACAADQGKFWEMYDRLFAGQRNLALPQLPVYAAAVPGLSQDDFRSCLASGRHAADIRRDMSMAVAAGVRATPTFFIATIDQRTQALKVVSRVNGAKPYAVFQQALDAAIATMR